MHIRILIAAALTVMALGSFAQSEDQAEAIATEEQKSGYSAGVRFGLFLESGKSDVSVDAILRGIEDVFEGRALALPQDELDKAYAGLQKQMAKNREELMSAEGTAFLEENGKKEGVVTLASGLQYKILKEAVGPTPSATDTVKTHYAGRLLDGTQFDSSYDRGKPTSFSVNRVISGWTEALQLMPVGSKWELYIPQNLAYGARGFPPTIPPFAALIFEIELLAIEN